MNITHTAINDYRLGEVENVDALRTMSDFISNDETSPVIMFYRDTLNDLLKEKDNGFADKDQLFLEDVVSEHIGLDDDEDQTHIYPDMYRFS